MNLPVPVPCPVYSQARESLVKAIPPKIICFLGCRGRDCRYEGPAGWSKKQQVIKGIFSNWVTDDIIAMARPSTSLINHYQVIEQFKGLNIKAIINMQLPGEHSHCGPPLDPDSGFTYSPQTFMENDIFFYNFGMPDYGVSSLIAMLDGVKVLAFAVKEGKVAVHCHAGLGRTGVLISCYLIYTLRLSPSEAVHYVRIKRPRSLQTRAQINMVFDFARLLGSQLTQYPDLRLRYGGRFTLQHYLNRQAMLLHGPEARALRHTPKVIYLLCALLPCLALGSPAPPEVGAELERRAAVRALGQAVGETLLSRRYQPLLRRSSVQGRGAASWYDQGFQERKKKLLRNRRSYSDSDLSKITDKEDLKLSSQSPLTGTMEQIRLSLRPVSPATAPPPAGHPNSGDNSQRPNLQAGSANTRLCAKKPRCTAKKTLAFPKYSSNVELCRPMQRKSTGQATAVRTVARVMAAQDPPGETVLQRAALLQEELNTSECAWALLVTESDPHVLTALLWAWLEKLKDPVLSLEDINWLTAGVARVNLLSVLPKPQQHTVACLLCCVGRVTSLCPLRQDAVLRRLIRALTRRHLEEFECHAALLKVFRISMREAVLKYNSLQ